MTEAVLDLVDRIAADVGRARRRVDRKSSLAFTLDRIAASMEGLDSMVRASAGELHRRGVPVDEAVAIVDQEGSQLRTALGLPEPGGGRRWQELNEPLTLEEQACWRRLGLRATP